MIVIPRGWSVAHELESFSLIHPEGREVAVIEYTERVRPLEKAGAIVRRLLAERPEFVPNEVPDLVERVTTLEGEYGALATIAGNERGQPVQRDLGIVFGDDFYARTSAACYRADQFEQVTQIVRDLVITDTHALGLRRRRFEYAPPRGWQPLVRGFVTDWLSPGYPDDAVHLTVYPANPLTIVPGNMLAILLGVPRHGRPFDRAQLHTSSGLEGEAGEILLAEGDGHVAKRAVVYRDERYAYSLEITARRAEQLVAHREELDAVFASVQPIPAAQDSPRDQDLAAHSYWIE